MAGAGPGQTLELGAPSEFEFWVAGVLYLGLSRCFPSALA